ncbi:hypothetical protein CCP3SC15_4020001 [Gammaproteobacteria bacterium]
MSLDLASVISLLSDPPSYAVVAFALVGLWYAAQQVLRRLKVDERSDQLMEDIRARNQALEEQVSDLHKKHVELAASASGSGSTVVHLQDKIIKLTREVDRLEREHATYKRMYEGSERLVDFISFQVLKLTMTFDGMRYSALPEDSRWDKLESDMAALVAKVSLRKAPEEVDYIRVCEEEKNR